MTPGIPDFGCAGAAAGLLLGGAWFPPDASSNGKGVDELFWLATTLTGIAFVLVVAILVWCVVAYRARPGRRAAFDHGDSRGAKVVTAVFAACVFLGLDVVLAMKDHEVWGRMYGDRSSLDARNSLTVQCLAKQFEWYFRYPGPDGKFGTDDDVRDPVLRIPDDRPTVVRLRSIDVIHSFFVPNWRTKQDALPGMTTIAVLHPAKGATGEYEIACAELCGMAHYRMRGKLIVLSRAGFDAWMEEQRKDIADHGPQTGGEESWAQYDRRSVAEAGR
jgi:cytochrome c oxidase subunit 2